MIQNEELAPHRAAAASTGAYFGTRTLSTRRHYHVDLWSDMMVKLDLWKAPDPERVRNRAAAPDARRPRDAAFVAYPGQLGRAYRRARGERRRHARPDA